MGMEYKTFATEFKAQGDKGEYEGYFSIFGNVDDGYDVIVQGAFAKTLQERARPGHSRIKVFYAHDWMKLIGPPPDILMEDSTGLYAKGRLTLASFWGNEAWQLMKDGAMREGSIGYEPIYDKVDYRNDGARILKEVKLYEISPVPLGMNALTEVAAVKALRAQRPRAAELITALMHEFKAGARHSKQDQEMLQQIHDAATALGAMCGDEDIEEPKGAAQARPDLSQRLRAAGLALALQNRKQ